MDADHPPVKSGDISQCPYLRQVERDLHNPVKIDAACIQAYETMLIRNVPEEEGNDDITNNNDSTNDTAAADVSTPPLVDVQHPIVGDVEDDDLHGRIKYIMLGIDWDSTTVKVLEMATVKQAPTYDVLYEKLLGDKPCYVIVDLGDAVYHNPPSTKREEGESKDEQDENNQYRSLPVFLSWVPETADVRAKMFYVAHKDTVKMSIGAMMPDVHVCDDAEACEYEVVMQVRAQLRE